MSYADNRFAITDTLQRYATCIDEFDFVGVADVFTDDAVIEYGGYPIISGGAQAAAFLQEHTASTAWHQHLLTVASLSIDGDAATTLTYFIAHAVPKANSESVRTNVGEYRDHLIHAADGWRICERRQKTGWKETRTRQPL